MNIASPTLAVLFLLLPLYWAVLALTRHRRGRRLGNLLSSPMQSRLVSPISTQRRFLKFVLLSLALFLLAAAAIRPRSGVRLEKIEQAGIDLCVAIDTSRSMLATDLAPSRLQVAKREIRRLLEQLDGDRVALVAFAGGAVLQAPLSIDYPALELFLEVIDETLISTQGTAIAAAIDLAREKVFTASEGDRVMILLTDGEDTAKSDVLGSAREAAKAGIRIYTVGLGSTSGSPIPAQEGKSGEYRKDASGEIVLSKLAAPVLEQIADVTGGRYFHVEGGKSALSAVIQEIAGLEGKRLEERTRTVYDEQFQILLLLAIFCLALEPMLGLQARKREIWRGRFA